MCEICILCLENIDIYILRFFSHQIQQEIDIHKQLNHENVVKMHEAFSTLNNVYMLLEACPQKVSYAFLLILFFSPTSSIFYFYTLYKKNVYKRSDFSFPIDLDACSTLP